MSEITSNPTASENEIKIEMKFWEAVEITQETYNNYQENADDDLDNLNIEKFQNSQNQKGNFNLYHKFHDKDSNFSGMTYIYDDEETKTVNVAIACRGSVLHWFNQNRFDEYLKKEKEENRYNDYEIVHEFLSSIKFSEETKKDWLRNNWGMLWEPNTDSDNFAEKYATKILDKIKDDEKYKNKEINIITLGHSKGGREAQKQMLRLLDEQKNKNYINNIYCLTFNSASCSKDDNKVKVNNCQNLIVYDNLTLSADPLSYKDWLIPIAILFGVNLGVIVYNFNICEISFLISFILLVTWILNLLKQKMQMTSGQIVLMMILGISGATPIYVMNLLFDNKMDSIEELKLLVCFVLVLVLSRIVIPKFPCIKLGKNCGNDCGYFVESADTLFNAHNLSSFLHEKSYYKDLKNMNVTDIIKLEKKGNLITLAEAERKKRGASANQTNVQKIN